MLFFFSVQEGCHFVTLHTQLFSCKKSCLRNKGAMDRAETKKGPWNAHSPHVETWGALVSKA